MKRIIGIVLIIVTLMTTGLSNVALANTKDSNLNITSTSAVLIEGSTGEIIFEKNKDERLKPASITKVMTLLLIFEAIESGKIGLDDMVTVSEYAASMGGSQVYFEPNEVQTVDTMIKCISVASANDGSVAMAEHIAGSEEAFVAMMNQRAKELGMNNTNFVNACGLDEDNHYSSAYDVALMSKELITKHRDIINYATIWMDTIIHTTKKGQSEFGLTNTNKLVRFYNGITGLKTGSTGLAKYCLSATANRNGMDLIAVILAAPDTKTRFNEATKLLDYGFANARIYKDNYADLVIEPIKVTKGKGETVSYQPSNEFSYLCLNDVNPSDITKVVDTAASLVAPIQMGDKVGEIIYSINGKEIGKVSLVATETIEKATFVDYFLRVLDDYFLGK